MSAAPERYEFLGMTAVVASPAMRALMRLVERVAQTDAAVLITGESGTGKELIARAIHQFSRRAAGPWVDINCAALPEHLIESELFGYEKGAFSGAGAAKPGLFELAHAGTLLLDEIGELDGRLQVKLLRVLDGLPYYRLGGVRKVAADVRLIAATNQDLEAAVAKGRFRQDLYHRISQVRIEAPPLRQRREDITVLAEFFLGQQDPRLRFTREALEELRRRDWPGNVRELRNAVVRAAIAAEGELVRPQDLPAEIRLPAGGAGEATDLEDLQRRKIFEVLARTGGHRGKAAELLGISRRTLSRRLKLYAEEETGAGFSPRGLDQLEGRRRPAGGR